MDDYNKIIESLDVKFASAKDVTIKRHVTVTNFYDVSNTVILLNRGSISFGEDQKEIDEGDLLMIPSGRTLKISYGKVGSNRIDRDELSSKMEEYFNSSQPDPSKESFSILTFDAKVFDSVNFFQSLDIPAFSIRRNERLNKIFQLLIEETQADRHGKERLIKVYTEEFMIELMRYILNHNMFEEQLATNATYFKDPRLLDLFGYIKENLDGDLSNKMLSNVANVSEDYVGQYFKMLTGINPQDYIEYQRMERAVSLLRTTKRSIREIGKIVGYKDTAYFCRRFKMMFGVPAGKMRKRESLMNF